VQAYTGGITVVAGHPDLAGVTVLHNRSIAEGVRVSANGAAFDGVLEIEAGRVVTPGAVLDGRSLLHSVPLTAEAFKRGLFGEWGQYAVTIGLTLFAFSTAIAWSYYGDRAMTYLFGLRTVMPYRVVYVFGFFLATIADTSLVWLISAVTLALMTLPNLIGIVLMRREVKQLTTDYWNEVKARRAPQTRE
jgi:AGCS family alanine or glycine:cation symporter